MSLLLSRTPTPCTLTLRTAYSDSGVVERTPSFADEDGYRGTVPWKPRSPSHRRSSFRTELIPPVPAPDVDLGRGAPIVAWPCSVGHPDSSGMESGLFRGNAEGCGKLL